MVARICIVAYEVQRRFIVSGAKWVVSKERTLL